MRSSPAVILPPGSDCEFLSNEGSDSHLMILYGGVVLFSQGISTMVRI